MYILAVILCFLGALSSSFVAIVVKRAKDVSVHIVNAYYGYYLTITTVIAIPIYRFFIVQSFTYNLSLTDVMLIGGSGYLTAVSSISLIYAF